MGLGVIIKQAGGSGESVIFDSNSTSEQRQSLGRLFVFLTSESKSINHKKIVSSINDSYYNSAGNSQKALEDEIKFISGKLTEHGVGVEIAALTFLGEKLFVVCGGGVEVSILRGTSIATILKSKAEVITASGIAKEGDIIILCSSKAAHSMGSEKIRTILTANNLEKSVVKVNAELGNESGPLGLLYFIGDSSGSKVKGIFGRFNKSKTGEVIQSDPADYKRHSLVESIKTKLSPRRSPSLPPTMQEVRSRKLTLTIGAILLLLLLVSIGFGSLQKSRLDALNVYEPELLTAIENLDSANELAGISPARARDNFVSAKTSAQKLIGEGVEDERLTKLIADISSAEGKVLGTYKIDSDVFLDLPLLSDPFEGDDLFLSEKTLLILDKANKKIVSVNLDTKRSEVVAGPSVLGSEEQVFGYANSVYTISDGGIYKIEGGKDIIIEKDWNGNSLGSAYAGNIYVLAKDDSNIFRFPAVASGFASRQNWLGDEAEPDFSGITSWAIDGSMWLLGGSGKVFKYALGAQQNFAFDSLPTSLQGATQIYTDENSNSIYLLIPDQKQILVASKDGVYEALYENEEIQFARDFAVSEAERKIIILTGDKLHEIEAKHLTE